MRFQDFKRLHNKASIHKITATSAVEYYADAIRESDTTEDECGIWHYAHENHGVNLSHRQVFVILEKLSK